MKRRADTPFGARLRLFVSKALRRENPATNSEIARFFDVVPSAAKRYVEEDRYPDLRKVIDISRRENLSLNWLFKGEGESDLDPLQFVEQSTRAVAQKLADDSRKPIEDILNKLLLEAFRKRGSDMLASEVQLPPKQIEELRLILSLIIDDANGEATDSLTSSRVTSKPRRSV